MTEECALKGMPWYTWNTCETRFHCACLSKLKQCECTKLVCYNHRDEKCKLCDECITQKNLWRCETCAELYNQVYNTSLTKPCRQ